MLLSDVLRLCAFGSGVDWGATSTETRASFTVDGVIGDLTGDSEGILRSIDVRVDHVLGGGRDPTGRVGRLLRRSCKKLPGKLLVYSRGMLPRNVVAYPFALTTCKLGSAISHGLVPLG